MPISYLNYSSLTQLLRNPLIFKMRDILGVYDGKMSVSGMIGKAGHKALQVYYGGDPNIAVPTDRTEARGMAVAEGLRFLDMYSDDFINYGKTGSREAMLKGYAQAMDFYFAEEPTYHEILMCEEKMTAELKTVDGEMLPLPASGVPDLVHQKKDGTVEIIDTKFVTSFTDYETEDYIKIVQAQFLFHLLMAAKGITADRVVFREIKRTKNMDGSPQIRDWAVPFDHEPYRIFFYNLYRDVVEYLKRDPIFLPNLSDPFDGEQAGLLYAQGLISADMSDVEVIHKVRDVAFVSKKFVASRLERAENKHLPAEERIAMRLGEFGIPVVPVETRAGASFTQYRFKVSAGVRMTTIKKHRDDIASVLATKGEVRIVAPIPGTELVGVEVENEKRAAAVLGAKDLNPGTMKLPVGADVNGEAVSVDLREMPHLLIAGTTGSGKSVLLHTLIGTLTKQMTPEEMQLILIDPKRVELSAFGKVKHLREKIIFDHNEAVRALLHLADEMEARYKTLEKAGKRDIAEYNASKRDATKRLPYVVCVVDEFADLMIRSKIEEEKQSGMSYGAKSKAWLYKEAKKRFGNLDEVIEHYTKADLIEMLEESDADDEMKRADANVELLMVRLAQLGRAAGIHMVIATQRPSVDVITGLIKANFPTRIALTTASATDSTIILGKPGAEKLSGKGDMLFMHHALRGEVRLQGFVLKK